MELISICYIAEGSSYRAIHSFQSLGFSIKEKETEFIVKDAPKEYIKTIGDIEVELFVIDKTNDKNTAEYFTPLATNLTTKEVPLSALVNDVVRMATGEYICIVPTGVFLQRDWLVNLIFYYKSIDKSGVVGIPSDIEAVEFLPVPSMDEEKLTSVFVEQGGNVQGVMFVNRQKFYLVGAIDESVFMKGEEFNHFCTRAQKIGLINYYVPCDNCIYIKYDDRSEEERSLSSENRLKSIMDMNKSRNYYIPL